MLETPLLHWRFISTLSYGFNADGRTEDYNSSIKIHATQRKKP